jgi:hypothetical protein
MTDGSMIWVGRGNSPAGRIVLGKPADPDVCPNCGRAVDEVDVTLEPPRIRKGLPDVPGQVELAVCGNDECRAQLARLRTRQGDTDPWNAVVADTEER